MSNAETPKRLRSSPFLSQKTQNQALILQGWEAGIVANPNPVSSNAGAGKNHGVMREVWWRALHIQPLRGGLRAIVPAPRGIREVGEFVVGDLDMLEWAGDVRPLEEELGVDGEPGETGFILRPLMPGCGGRGACDVGAADLGIEERGVGGRIFSRWLCR